MKCHYEILEVSREATADEIKNSYRKLALKWHPDKNLENQEHAKEQFQAIQQAFQVLSDPQERAWYDKYREQILRGPSSNFEDDSIDIFQYFTTTCFKGYGDDENGFYIVYSNVFDEITKDELKFMENKSEFLEIPKFGNSKSDYENVKIFYNYWSSFQTSKSFAWLNLHDIRDSINSRTTKYYEKENKKVRQKAKKEWNEEVRNLVGFVRKRDKRVQKQSQIEQARILENRQKQEELRKKKKLDRIERLKESEEPEWAKFDKIQAELENIELHLNEQFGSDNDSEESDEEDLNNLYCVACNKIFKTPKSFQNHESSKKHKEAVEKLREKLLEEEDELDSSLEDNEEMLDSSENCSNEANGDSDASESKIRTPKQDKIYTVKIDGETKILEWDTCDEAAIYHSDSSEVSTNKKLKKSKKKNKILQGNIQNLENSDKNLFGNTSQKPEENWNEDDTRKKSKKQSKKSKKTTKTDSNSNDLQLNEKDNPETKNVNTKSEKSKNKKSKSKRNKGDETDDDDMPKSIVCLTCQSEFQSKNKLFEHLKTTRHGIPLISKKTKGKN